MGRPSQGCSRQKGKRRPGLDGSNLRLATQFKQVRQIPIEQFKRVVESRHGGTAIFVQSVPVHETDKSLTFWNGVVHVFDLRGQPDGAFRAYICYREGEVGENHLFSILHSAEIYSPVTAGRAARAAEAMAPMVARLNDTGVLICSHCNYMAPFAGEGGSRAALPAGFHAETRAGAGQVVVCNQCDEILPPP